MAERSGVADQEILRELEALGYTPEAVVLLHLVPLVEMAWAEGRVANREQALIIEAARARGIEAGSAADQQLASWLPAVAVLRGDAEKPYGPQRPGQRLHGGR